MASELRVNTLKDASGNNSIATSFVAGGSAKAWGDANHSANTIADSLNISTITDDGTGEKDYNFTTSFGSENFIGTCGSGGNQGGTGNARAGSTNGVWTSGQAIMRFCQIASTGSIVIDDVNAYTTFMGDLA
tara:strand:- start:17 stop:412 length:396 start_codon:yes stop_codon:yes gene_type:complete